MRFCDKSRVLDQFCIVRWHGALGYCEYHSAKKTTLTKEDREKNRQMLLAEIQATCEAEHEERQRQRQKKLECRADLLGQIDYNERRRWENREEQERMNDRHKQAEQLFDDEVKYLLEHPMNLKWNPRRKQLPEQVKIPCSNLHWHAFNFCRVINRFAVQLIAVFLTFT